MKRLWYVRIRKRGPRFAVRIFNVFDNCEPDKPIDLELENLESVEALVRALGPVAYVAQIYMDVNGQGALLRTSMLPVQPIDELLRLGREDLSSLSAAAGYATSFQTREEILDRLRAFPR